MSQAITLTTDFGHDSSYVAAMKGVILSLNPAATIVDISHTIRPQNIAAGAFVLGEASRWFPPDSVHVAVVDPGVGTDRKIIYARVGEQRYVCPDNGLLSYVCHDRLPDEIVEVTNRSLFLARVTNTFHGRDIMAPVAAHLSLGLPPQTLGSAAANLRLMEWPQPLRRERAVTGRILFADSFGNLITNIRRQDVPEEIEPGCLRVKTAQHQFDGIVQTYLESPPGTSIALFGSSDLLELAVVQGNAASQLSLRVGDDLDVTW